MADALSNLNYQVHFSALPDPRPGDLFVTWNRHESRDGPVKAHEKAGGSVLVVENGYFGREHAGKTWLAMAMGQHNGAGAWPEGSSERWRALEVDVKPWRKDGEEIVILASRNMGSAKCREPMGWSDNVAAFLKADVGLPVRIRRHPGPQGQKGPVALEDDLANAWAVVTWGSSAALKAMAIGVPVFHGFQKWIGAGASRPYARGKLERVFPDRIKTFERVASAMWTVEEIAIGKAFRCLLT